MHVTHPSFLTGAAHKTTTTAPRVRSKPKAASARHIPATQQCLGAVSQHAQHSECHAPEPSRSPAAIPDWATSAPERRARWSTLDQRRDEDWSCAAPVAAGCAEEVQRRSWRAVEWWVDVRAGLALWWSREGGGGGGCVVSTSTSTRDWKGTGGGRRIRSVGSRSGLGMQFVVAFFFPHLLFVLRHEAFWDFHISVGVEAGIPRLPSRTYLLLLNALVSLLTHRRTGSLRWRTHTKKA